MTPYTFPSLNGAAFNCPHCNAYANQAWGDVYANIGTIRPVGTSRISFCAHCKKFCLWVSGAMIYPLATPAPRPNPDLPSDIQDDFEEARQIVARSPRGAAALLRLCIQKLCKHLGEKGKNINADIASLVAKGLPSKVQQALDTVRVVGNNAVHPGQIDLKDDVDTATALFHLVNVITEVMISQPNQVDLLYQSLVPEPQREAIAKRDGV